LVESLEDFSTPAPPRTIVKHPDKEYTLIPVDQQTKYRSGVGILLYLVNHTKIDVTKSVKDLSKVNDGAIMAH
jgi:hypothetical protein